MLLRHVDGEGYEFATLQRMDDRSWQGVAGGGGLGETPAQAAVRECGEEAGVPASAPYYSNT